MEYQAVVYNQPSNSQHNSNSTNQNNVRRGGTFMALRRIFGNWRRGNSIRPQLQNETWCIWLGEFEEGQVLIQLKCNQKHWFHVDCIEGWATSNNTWPIWRTNYVDIAKEENRRSFKTDSLSIHSISNEERT